MEVRTESLSNWVNDLYLLINLKLNEMSGIILVYCNLCLIIYSQL